MHLALVLHRRGLRQVGLPNTCACRCVVWCTVSGDDGWSLHGGVDRMRRPRPRRGGARRRRRTSRSRCRSSAAAAAVAAAARGGVEYRLVLLPAVAIVDAVKDLLGVSEPRGGVGALVCAAHRDRRRRHQHERDVLPVPDARRKRNRHRALHTSLPSNADLTSHRPRPWTVPRKHRADSLQSQLNTRMRPAAGALTEAHTGTPLVWPATRSSRSRKLPQVPSRLAHRSGSPTLATPRCVGAVGVSRRQERYSRSTKDTTQAA